MRLLCLSPYPERIRPTFDDAGDVVTATSEPLTPELIESADWIVSYGYRHILRRPILDRFPRRAINLHISFLPWNKGAHPNYWSWADGTPSGVTIHEIDEGVDTGPIIAQRMLCMSPERTFADTYSQLQFEIEEMFARSWPVIRSGKASSHAQTHAGSVRRARELPTWPNGWNARISDVVGKP